MFHSNVRYLSKLKPDLKKIPNRIRNRICVLDINDHNNQVCKRIESALSFSAEELKQSALILDYENISRTETTDI